jgi:hypothetical protein
MNRYRNEKADVGRIGSNEKLNKRNGLSNGFSIRKYNLRGTANQCKICYSDYMKFAIDNVCVDCQQRAEFIQREHSHVIRKVQQQGGEVYAK